MTQTTRRWAGLRRRHVAGFVAALGMVVLMRPVEVPAQMGAFSGFGSIHADAIQSNARTGDFTIPSRFTASRGGMDVSGDRASGNATAQTATVEGHVVVHMTNSVSLVGSSTGATQGPSTLTCDHLELDAGARVYHAVGHVHFIQAGRSVSADHADFDEASNQLRLSGNISAEGSGRPGAMSGFDTLRASVINSQAGGEFSIPGRFIATRQGVEITGDRAQGNAEKKRISVIGHVVVRVEKRSGTLTCDRLEIDESRHLYHAAGQVRYKEPSREMLADAADMNDVTHMLHLQGQVRLTEQ